MLPPAVPSRLPAVSPGPRAHRNRVCVKEPCKLKFLSASESPQLNDSTVNIRLSCKSGFAIPTTTHGRLDFKQINYSSSASRIVARWS